jgi:UDP-N-acetylmuramoyl-tripeptide--D-alanyl-D-alanine ligase
MFGVSDILNAVANAQVLQGNADRVFPSVSLDSRTIKAGELFFAVQGSRDGHQFVDDALRAGAAGVVVSTDEISATDGNSLVIRVPDTLQALQQTAAGLRLKYGTKIVAITGSAGKTTTKDLAAHVLGTRLCVAKSPASFNNHFGLPLTILALDPACQHAVLEVGVNHIGELAPLARIAKPNVAVITNIGFAHIEHFGSQEAILQEKAELARALDSQGLAILNGDDPLLAKLKQELCGRGLRVVTVGIGHDCDIRAEITDSSVSSLSGYVFAQGMRAHWTLRTPARHFVYSALIAVAASVWAGLDIESATASLGSFEFTAGRLRIVEEDTVTIIDDTYNASPEAMIAALRALAGMTKRTRIAVLGEMRELGPFSDQCHEMVGREAAAAASDLVTVGEGGAVIARAAQSAGLDPHHLWSVESATEALQIVKELCYATNDTVVLAKGARFTHMERVVLGLQGADVRCTLSRCTKYINCSECPLLEAV